MNNLSLPEDIKSEFLLDVDGKAFASRRAIARLAGVDEKSVRDLISKISSAELPDGSIFEIYVGQSFEGAELIPDTLVSLIVEYYAYECPERYRKEQAKIVCRAFRAIGFRAWVQSELNWQKPNRTFSQFDLIAQLASEASKLEKRVEEAERKLWEIENDRRQAEEELKALPIASEPAPEKSTRAKINEIVRSYATRTKASYNFAWNKLYSELYYRCHIDVNARARRRKETKLDIIEEAGFIEQLHAIASEILAG